MQGDTFHLYMPHLNHVEAEIQEVVKQVPVLKVTDHTMSAIDSILKNMGQLPKEKLMDYEEVADVESSTMDAFDAGLIGGGVGIMLTLTFILYCIYKQRHNIRLKLKQKNRKKDEASDERNSADTADHATDNSIFSPPELGEEGRKDDKHRQSTHIPLHPVMQSRAC